MTRWITGLGLVIAVALFAVYRPLFFTRPAPAENEFDLAAFVINSAEDVFDSIEHPWHFRFPADHGGHHRYRTETWQLSGVLKADGGRRFGLQLAVARIALHHSTPVTEGGWDSRQLYAGMLVFSDPGGDQSLSSERLTLGGPGLAGWQAEPLRLWIEDWSVIQIGARDRAPDLELRVAANDFALSLRLQDQQGLVIDEDLAGRNNDGRPPFVFYVQPRLDAQGELRSAEQVIEVSGSLSIEHAWGELPLPGGPVVRDRFSLYLEDGRVLMLVRSHRRDGSGQPTAFGLMARADGATQALGDDDIELEPLEPENGETGFPLTWKLYLPGESLEFEFDIEGQALNESGRATSLSGVLRLDSRQQSPAGIGFAHLEGYYD